MGNTQIFFIVAAVLFTSALLVEAGKSGRINLVTLGLLALTVAYIVGGY